jgi:hypothetical protein
MLKSKFSLSRHFEYANEQITYHFWLLKTKRYQQYSKGNYNKEREDTGTFACDK